MYVVILQNFFKYTNAKKKRYKRYECTKIVIFVALYVLFNKIVNLIPRVRFYVTHTHTHVYVCVVGRMDG